MYFWLNYCDGNPHVERIPVASEITKANDLNLFLLSDGTRIDDNEYLESLENGTELSAGRNKSRNCRSILN